MKAVDTNEEKRITKDELVSIIMAQDKWGYNRQIEPTYMKHWNDDSEYHLRPTMAHHHKKGEGCEEHLRTVLIQNETQVIAFIDMPFEYYEQISGKAGVSHHHEATAI